MPRVLMPRETDATAVAEKQEAYEMIRRSMKDIMAKHNTTFLTLFRQMMISVFGPGMEKVLSRTSPQGPNGETGESSAAVNGQPTQDASARPPQQSMGSQLIQQQNPYQAMPNPPTYREMAFGTTGVPLALLTG
jgi:hypothetical protein